MTQSIDCRWRPSTSDDSTLIDNTWPCGGRRTDPRTVSIVRTRPPNRVRCGPAVDPGRFSRTENIMVRVRAVLDPNPNIRTGESCSGARASRRGDRARFRFPHRLLWISHTRPAQGYESRRHPEAAVCVSVISSLPPHVETFPGSGLATGQIALLTSSATSRLTAGRNRNWLFDQDDFMIEDRLYPNGHHAQLYRYRNSHVCYQQPSGRFRKLRREA